MRRTLKDIADPRQSDWKSEADNRRVNPWQRHYSSQIARRILAILKSDPELSISKVAAELGVSPQYISKVVKGKENLTLETIYKLSKALKTELISFPTYEFDSQPSKWYEISSGSFASGNRYMNVPLVPSSEQGGSLWAEFKTSEDKFFEISSLSQ